MQPGDLVEFKDGLFGIDAPRNLGIVTERQKKGKEVHLMLFTVEGPRKAQATSVAGVGIDTGLSGDEDGRTLRDALSELIDDVEAARRTPPSEPSDRDLWEAAGEGTYTPRDLAEAYYDLRRPLPDHVASVAEALEACGPGIGYFRQEGRAWRAIPADDVQAARRQLQELNRLRNRLVRVETVEADDGYEEEVYLPIEDPDLDEADRELLEEVVAPYMRGFLLHDEDRGQVGLGGTDVRAIDGFSLRTYCKHLARDVTRQEGTSISSTYARFLLQLGLETLEDLYGMITRRWVYKSPFDWEVPGAAERAADRLEPFDHDGGRRDLRDLETYTIDPPDAKDFDDAVSLTADALWVHIADVSHYVRPGTTMDTEAGRRSTSVYLPTRVLPMLPARLADDLCSLKEQEDRPAVSVRLPLDGSAPTFATSTVHVDRNLAYGQVEEWIGEGREPFASMSALAETWLSDREGLSLRTEELRVGMSEGGVEITTKRATPATRMIEAFMVAANEAVAGFLADREVPVPYRCHPLPERPDVERFNGQAEAMGLEVRLEVPDPEEEGTVEEDASQEMLDALKEGGKLQMGFTGAGDPGDEDPDEEEDEPAGPARKGLAQLDADQRREWLQPFQAALDEINALEDDRLRQVANGKLLSCMGRAAYTVDNVGHFGLGSIRYVHFTSPIRRYPDLLVHRQLKATLAEDEAPYGRSDLEPRCERSTDHAIEAERLEWKLKDVALVFQSIDEEWEGVQGGIVNGVSPGGAFLSLDKGLEARIAVQDLPGGPLHVDDAEARLLDEDDGTVIRLGQRVAVRLTSPDLVEGQVGAVIERVGAGPDAE